MIANAHLVFADLSDDGAKCEPCLQLAALHSKAVDFPKSGVPAVFPKVGKLLACIGSSAGTYMFVCAFKYVGTETLSQCGERCCCVDFPRLVPQEDAPAAR